MKNKLIRAEVILGLISIILTSILLATGKEGYISILLSLASIGLLIVSITKREEHAYWGNNTLMYIFSLFCKLFVYIALIFILLSYPWYDLIAFIAVFLCVAYAILAQIFNKESNEILSIYLYSQVLVVFFMLFGI